MITILGVFDLGKYRANRIERYRSDTEKVKFWHLLEDWSEREVT